MKRLMPLRRVVVEVTNEVDCNDPEGNRRAIKGWHNRLNNGSIPRHIVTKLGRELFLDLEAWEKWMTEKDQRYHNSGPGRPRAK